ncbi:MAG: hypothetical protein H7Y43_10880 [Akkermansiaceae bacterium]|nr:hypothetical protein [Verrucomicrobiales bacterium]
MKGLLKLSAAVGVGVVAGAALSGCVHNPTTDAKPLVRDLQSGHVLQQHGETFGTDARNYQSADQQFTNRSSRVSNYHVSTPPAPQVPTTKNYRDPALSNADIIFIGAGTFEDDGTNRPANDPETAPILNGLGNQSSQDHLRAMTEEFFKQVSAANPQIKARVVTGTERGLIGKNLDRTVLATIAFNNVSIISSAPGSGGGKQVFVSLPLFLVSAKSYHLIYTRPLFVRIRLEAGVTPSDPEIIRRILAEARAALLAGLNDPREIALAAAALQRGAFRDPNHLVYAVEEDSVTFSEKARSGQTGFSQASTVTPLLRDALSHFLARTEIVFPPIQAAVSSRLYRGLGASYYGLAVVTDLLMPQGFPTTDSGRIILPVSRVEADIRVKAHVKTGVRVTEQAPLFSAGVCQVLLELSALNRDGTTLQSIQRIQDGGFTVRRDPAAHADQECLMESLLACASQLKEGFK